MTTIEIIAICLLALIFGAITAKVRHDQRVHRWRMRHDEHYAKTHQQNVDRERWKRS